MKEKVLEPVPPPKRKGQKHTYQYLNSLRRKARERDQQKENKK